MTAAALIWIALAAAQPQTNFGPFVIAGDSFTVVVHDKMDVLDRKGAVAYELDASKFKEVASVSAKLLPAGDLTGLLLQYRKGNEEYWQVLRNRNGKFGPLDVSNAAVPSRAGVSVVGRPVTTNRGEMAELKVWAGNFYMFVPIRIDWLQGRITSGQQCLEMIAGGLTETGCEMRAEARRQPVSSDLGFVRLFREANERMGLPRHVVLKKDSSVEILAARAIAKFELNEDLTQTVLSDVWLKVLIDNNEDNLGWIHTNEDFAAVGLPAGSPVQ